MEITDTQKSFIEQLQMQLDLLQQKLIKAQLEAVEYQRQINALKEQIKSGDA